MPEAASTPFLDLAHPQACPPHPDLSLVHSLQPPMPATLALPHLMASLQHSCALWLHSQTYKNGARALLPSNLGLVTRGHAQKGHQLCRESAPFTLVIPSLSTNAFHEARQHMIAAIIQSYLPLPITWQTRGMQLFTIQFASGFSYTTHLPCQESR